MVYKTTPQSIDALRDMFSFHTDSICSYEVGKPQLVAPGIGSVGESKTKRQRNEMASYTNDDPGSTKAGVDNYNNGNDKSLMADVTSRVDTLEEQLLKVENLMLLYNERIETLEELGQRSAMKSSIQQDAHL